MKKHDKPVGIDGVLKVGSGPSYFSQTFLRHFIPQQKDEIESKVIETFRRFRPNATFKQLGENDFDFEWTESDRTAKLELTELVLAYPPYREKSGERVYCRDWSEKFSNLVQKKNNKSYNSSMPIDLLVYTTHFAYHGNDIFVDLASEYLRNRDAGSSFDRVYYLECSGDVSKLFLLKPYRVRLPARLRKEYEEEQFQIRMNLSSGVKPLT